MKTQHNDKARTFYLHGAALQWAREQARNGYAMNVQPIAWRNGSPCLWSVRHVLQMAPAKARQANSWKGF